MAHYLVVAHQTSGSRELQREVQQLKAADPGVAFSVLVPSTPVSHRFTWEDSETIAAANRMAARAKEMIESTGAPVMRVTIGARVPIDAIEDELREHPAYDGIIISTLPPGISRWLRLDLLSQARRRTGLPVTHVISAPDREPAMASVATAPAEQPAAAPGETERGAPPPPQPPPPRSNLLLEEDVAVLEFPEIRDGDLPDALQQVWQRLDHGSEVSPLFERLGENPPLLHAYTRMLSALWQSSGLGTEMRELVILRVAYLVRSEYVWQEHVRIARQMGVSDDRIHAIQNWNSTELVHFDRRERSIFAYVDAIERGHGLEAARQHLGNWLSPETIVGLNLLVGFYRMTGCFTEAMGLKPEGRFVGWALY